MVIGSESIVCRTRIVWRRHVTVRFMNLKKTLPSHSKSFKVIRNYTDELDVYKVYVSLSTCLFCIVTDILNIHMTSKCELAVVQGH